MSVQYTCIGTIVNTQGLNGELRLKENIDISEFFDKFDKIMLKSGNDYIPFNLKKIVKHSKKGWVVTLKNIDDIKKAETFIFRDIYIPSSFDYGNETFDIDEAEIEYFTIVNDVRYALLEIKENGNEDLLTFANENGKEMHIPHIDHFVVDIDHESGEIVLQNFDGLDEI